MVSLVLPDQTMTSFYVAVFDIIEFLLRGVLAKDEFIMISTDKRFGSVVFRGVGVSSSKINSDSLQKL